MRAEPGVPQQLDQQLIAALSVTADQCVDGDSRRLDWDDVVRVSDFHAAEAARCQAKVAMPDDGFEPRIFNTFKTIGLHSLEHVDEFTSRTSPTASTTAPPTTAPTTPPTTAVQMYMAARRADTGRNDPDSWIGEYLRGAEPAERTQAASRAITWLSRTLQVLADERDPDPATGNTTGNTTNNKTNNKTSNTTSNTTSLTTSPTGATSYKVSQKVEWRFPGRGLVLQGRVDLQTGAASARVPIIVIPSRNEANEARVAFLALLWTITNKLVPSEVVVVTHATGVRARVAPEDLFERGIEAARVAAAALVQRPQGPAGLTRTPSFFTCRDCDWRADCAEFDEHQRRANPLDGPAIRGGIRLSR